LEHVGRARAGCGRLKEPDVKGEVGPKEETPEILRTKTWNEGSEQKGNLDAQSPINKKENK